MKFNLRIKPSRKNRSLALVALVGLAAATTLMATAPQHDASALEEKAWPVTTMAIEARDLSPELRLFGRVESPSHSRLTAGVTATVTAVNAREGDVVEAGQLLLTLDDADVPATHDGGSGTGVETLAIRREATTGEVQSDGRLQND